MEENGRGGAAILNRSKQTSLNVPQPVTAKDTDTLSHENDEQEAGTACRPVTMKHRSEFHWLLIKVSSLSEHLVTEAKAFVTCTGLGTNGQLVYFIF